MQIENLIQPILYLIYLLLQCLHTMATIVLDLLHNFTLKNQQITNSSLYNLITPIASCPL